MIADSNHNKLGNARFARLQGGHGGGEGWKKKIINDRGVWNRFN